MTRYSSVSSNRTINKHNDGYLQYFYQTSGNIMPATLFFDDKVWILGNKLACLCAGLIKIYM